VDEVFYSRHYIVTDEQRRITDGWSDGPYPEKDASGAVLLTDKGSYQFRLFPDGEENPALFDWLYRIPLYQWDGEQVTARPEEEIEAERETASQPTEAQARAQRDRLLAETDWTQVLDAPIDTKTREAYRIYRQALRDVPEQAGFPAAIVWPELPEAVKAEPDPVDAALDALLGEEVPV